MALLRLVIVAVLVAVSAGALQARGRSDGFAEPDVKAACIFNAAKFVRWSESAFPSTTAPLLVAVVGDGPLATSLAALDGKTVGGRPVTVTKAAEPPADARLVVFLEMPTNERLAAVHGRHAISCSDAAGFAERGGILEVGVVHRRLSMTVNLGAARRAGLTISAQLLKLARRVSDDGGEGAP